MEFKKIFSILDGEATIRAAVTTLLTLPKTSRSWPIWRKGSACNWVVTEVSIASVRRKIKLQYQEKASQSELEKKAHRGDVSA